MLMTQDFITLSLPNIQTSRKALYFSLPVPMTSVQDSWCWWWAQYWGPMVMAVLPFLLKMTAWEVALFWAWCHHQVRHRHHQRSWNHCLCCHRNCFFWCQGWWMSETYRIEWSPLSWGKDQLKSEIDRDKVIWARGTTDQSLKNTDWNYFLIKW